MRQARRSHGVLTMLGMVLLSLGILVVVIEIGHMMVFVAKVSDIADAAARAAAQEVVHAYKEQTGHWYLERPGYPATYDYAAERVAIAAARANGIRKLIGRDLVPGDNIQVSVASVDSQRRCLESDRGSSYYFTVGEQRVYQCARVTISVPYYWFVVRAFFDLPASPGRITATASAIPVVTYTR